MALITKRRLLLIGGGIGLGGYFTLRDDSPGESLQQENSQFPFEGNRVEISGEGDFIDTVSIQHSGASILTFEYNGDDDYELIVLDSSQGVVETVAGEGPTLHRLMLPTSAGDYDFRVIGETGSWEMVIEDHVEYSEENSNVSLPPIEYSGEDVDYIGPILFDVEQETEFEVAFEASSGEQSVRLYDPTGRAVGEIETFDLDEMDSSTGVVSKFVNGVGFIGVDATGAWELKIDEVPTTTSGSV